MGNKKRENYRTRFYNYDAQKIVEHSPKDFDLLMQDPGIIRNRLKINAIINNANQYLEMLARHGSFVDYLWQHVDGEPIINHWQDLAEIPKHTTISDKMSKQLKKDGFKFIGSTICYAFMQASGMVNDHTKDCFLYANRR